MKPITLKNSGKVLPAKVTQIRSGVAASVFDFDESESDGDIPMNDGTPDSPASSRTPFGDLVVRFSTVVQHLASICSNFEASLRDADGFVLCEDFSRAILSWKRALTLYQRYESLVGEVAILTSRCDTASKNPSQDQESTRTSVTTSREMSTSMSTIAQTMLPHPSTYPVVLCEYLAQAYLHLATTSSPSRSDTSIGARNPTPSSLTGQQSRWLMQALAAADEGLQWAPTSYAHLLSSDLLATPLAHSMGIYPHAQAAVRITAASAAPSSAAPPHTAQQRALVPGRACPWLWLMKAHCLLHLNRVTDAVVAAGRARDAIQSWEDAALPSDAAQGAVASPPSSVPSADAIGVGAVRDNHEEAGVVQADVAAVGDPVPVHASAADGDAAHTSESIVCPRSGQVWPRLQGTQAARYRDVESMLQLAHEEYRAQMASHQRALREYQLRSHGNTMLACPDFERCCDTMQRETRFHLIHGYTVAEGERRREENKLEAEQLLRRR